MPTAVGTYNVTPSAATVVVTPAADQTKYSATYVYVGGTLTITAATLTVTAGNVSITVGGTITPTSAVSGVVRDRHGGSFQRGVHLHGYRVDDVRRFHHCSNGGGHVFDHAVGGHDCGHAGRGRR